MSIAYLGKNPVTFGFQAAQKLGETDEMIGCASHAEVYETVAKGDADLGLLALENQLAGIVDESTHSIIDPILTQAKPLSKSDTIVRIAREVTVPVELYLMNQSGKVEDIRQIRTHPVPMRQSRGRLDELSLGARFSRETCLSTDAAAQAASEDPEVAAIASKLAPSGYPNLKVIQRIDDPIPNANYENVTRFWVIEKHPGGTILDPAMVKASGVTHKICLLFNLERDESGGLARSLQVFAENGINLAMIFSLPRRDRSWEYTFVLEFEVEAADIDQADSALEALGEFDDFTLLGIYPKAQG
ncbi:MAG: prephenate dehydratase domain-containing protein [Verrucomicrobiota bacterium]